MLWSEKHKPQKLADIIGHSKASARLSEWAGLWKAGKPQKALLLHGGTGVGKTAIAHALANESGFELLEMNASDLRNTKAIDRIAGLASVSRTLSGKMRLILFDEIDGLSGSQDRGGASAVAKIIKEPQCPILLTANDVWDLKLRTIAFTAEKIPLTKVNYLSIANFLMSIVRKEGVEADKEALKKIAENCNGDIRSAINDLQQIAEGKNNISEKDTESLYRRDKKEDMFEVTRVILRTMDFGTSRKIISEADEDPGFILNWVDENVPKEYKNKEDLHRAYENLSRSDIFMGRISRRQNWGLLKYSLDLMSAGVSLSKPAKYSGFTMYSFPSVIKYLSSSKKERELRKSIASRIAKLTHTSRRVAVQDYLPMYTELIKDKDSASRIAAQLELSEDELKFLGAKRPKDILKRAELIREEHIKSLI